MDSITIDLGPNQSRALSDAAPDFGSVFLVVCRQSHPDDPQRYRLHVVPSSVALVADALKVAVGQMKATKPKRTAGWHHGHDVFQDAPNIENSIAHSCNRHPVEDFEPESEAETTESDRVLIIRGLMEVIFRRPRLSSALPLDSAWRKFVALSYVLRPELCGGESQTALASRLGVTKAAFSRLCVWWSERLGVTHPGMKSREAREIYSRIQLGHPSYKPKGNQSFPLPIGQAKRRPQDIAQEEMRLARLRQDFLEARTWRKLDKELLHRRGLIDEDGVLTTAGREWVETDPHPPKESLPGAD